VVNRARTLAEFVTHIRRGRITALALTPAHLAALLDHPADMEPLLPAVRAMVVGSAPLTHERRLQVRRKLTPNFYEQLGVNEAGLLILGSPTDQDARPAAIGRVVCGVEARIVGDDGGPLPAGEVGLVGFRGEGFPVAYLDDSEATARAFRDGWFYPGDLAAIDADGFFHFKGRADDVINTAGVKFYPIEVEKVLLAHPSVAEVAVFGWPDAERGEIAVAYIVARRNYDAEALNAWCRERIAGYKVPRWWVTVDQLPRNPAGKIVKRRLKEAFRAARAEADGAA
jgi:acyl-CoA synthetase (AMP-forming)/AMP-acid ligase II